MATFTIGTEVLYGGNRFVITSLKQREPFTVRLLATTPSGPRVVLARRSDLERITRYTEPSTEKRRD